MNGPKKPRGARPSLGDRALSAPRSAVPPDLERYRRKRIAPPHLGPDPGVVAPGDLADENPRMIVRRLDVMMVVLMETRDAIRDSISPKMAELSNRLGSLEVEQSKNTSQLRMVVSELKATAANMNDRVVAVERRITAIELAIDTMKVNAK